MGAEVEINWMLVLKPKYWQGIVKHLDDNPDKPDTIFEVTKEGSRVYPLGHKVFLCSGDAATPVAIVKICGVNVIQPEGKKPPQSIIKLQVSYRLSRSRQMNLKEVFRHLI